MNEYKQSFYDSIGREMDENAEEILNKKRKCYRCGAVMVFSNFWVKNLSYESTFLLKMWGSENVELHCCDCYKIREREAWHLD